MSPVPATEDECVCVCVCACSVQSTHDLWQKNLAQLERQYRITNIPLLIKSSAVLVVVILLFFIANVIPGIELELGEYCKYMIGERAK